VRIASTQYEAHFVFRGLRIKVMGSSSVFRTTWICLSTFCETISYSLYSLVSCLLLANCCVCYKTRIFHILAISFQTSPKIHVVCCCIHCCRPTV